MSESRQRPDDKAESPFSPDVRRELAELGLEAEDLLALDTARGNINNKVMRLVGGANNEKIINLTEKIKEEIAVYIKTLLNRTLSGTSLKRNIYEFCGYDIDKVKTLIEVAKAKNELAAGGLIGVKDVYGGNKEMFEAFADVAKEHGYFAVKTLADAKSIYSGNKEMFEAFTDVAKEHGDPAVHALAAAKDIYGGSKEMFKAFADLAKEHGSYAVKALAAAKNVYGDDFEVFVEVTNLITDLAKEHGYSAVKILADAKDVYADNFEVFVEVTNLIADLDKEHGYFAVKALIDAKDVYADNFEVFVEVTNLIADLSKEHGDPAVNALTDAKSIYGGNKEMFKAFANLSKEHGYFAVKALIDAKDVYADNFEVFIEVANLIADLDKGHKYFAVEALTAAKSIYGDNKEIFKAFADLAKEHGIYAVKALAAAKNVYGDDFEVFVEVANLITDLAKEHGTPVVKSLIDVKDAYGDNKEMFKAFADLAKEHGIYAVKALAAAKNVYGDNKEMFNTFADVAKERGDPAVNALAAAKNVYGDNKEMFKAFADVAKEHGESAVKALANAKDIYGDNLKMFRISVSYFDLTDIFDINVLGKYVEIVEKSGKIAGHEYIEGLPNQVRGLIGSTLPKELRKLPEYNYLVKYVFPDGNYSTYENNLACGDKLEHIENYIFDREGTTTTMTGLLGYKMKDGEYPDDTLLTDYTKRLGKIRSFVASRGPDNEALQEAFVNKIDTIFTTKAWPEFQQIEDLSLQEKMLCLFIGEAVRRKQKGKNSTPDAEICDLIVEYKYAYNENLEAYINNSADMVQSYEDGISRNYMLLAELSVIYGENVKHVLRHDIFENLEEASDDYAKILDVFADKVGQDQEVKDLTKKQWKRIINTFNNPHIPDKGKTMRIKNKRTGKEEDKYKPGKDEVLYKQVYGIFSSNIEFDNNEEKEEFNQKLATIYEDLKDNFTIETFRELLPRLYKLRSLYRSRITPQLSDLFNYDINTIFAELAKYEENVEVEAKEKTMGGAKNDLVKKSAKERRIRSYITKTAETANARMGAYLCIAGDQQMWENPNYFEDVMVDEDTGKCVGLSMLMNIKAQDGKKYLWFGPNPFESFLGNVSSKKCYDYMYDKVCKFAEENGYDGVVVPAQDERILGECTNRGGDFPGFIKASRLRDKKGNLKTVEFGEKHMLGGGYVYENGALVWESKA